MPAASEAHLGLARISYEWNDLSAAEQHGRISAQLARQVENTDNFIGCEVFLARLKLARGDAAGAAAILDKAGQSVRQHNFVHRMPEVAAERVLTLLRQGNLTTAARAAESHALPMSQARVHLAQGNPSAALTVLEPWRRQVEEKGWADERLKVMILQTLVYHADGEKERALQLLGDVLALAEPEGFIRTLVDEELPMVRLLSEAAARGMMPEYVARLLAAFETEPRNIENKSSTPAQPLVEPLSQRELEILQLIAQGLSNREISERLYLALDTVKGHNRNIFDKLQVQRRTEAVARARDLGLV
jgi:LuxR family maltose regulon positive regulatory protein